MGCVCPSVACLDLTRERKGLSPKLAGWKSITLVTRESTEMSKGQRSRSPGRLMLKPKVCRLRTSNLVGGWSMPWSAIKVCEVGLLHAGGAYSVSAAPGGGHTTCFITAFHVLYS